MPDDYSAALDAILSSDGPDTELHEARRNAREAQEQRQESWRIEQEGLADDEREGRA